MHFFSFCSPTIQPFVFLLFVLVWVVKKGRSMADRRLSNTFGKVLKEPKGVEDVLPKLLPFISTTFQSIDKLLDQCGKSKQERVEEGTYLSDQIRELLLSRLKKHETDKEEHERKMLELIEKYRQDVIGYWQELEIPEEDRQSPIDLWLNGTDETFAEGLSLVQKYRAAQSKAEELAGEIRRLKETVPVLLPKICHLWEELSVSKSDRDPLWKVLNVEDIEEKRAAFLQQCISNPTATTTHTFPLKAIEAVCSHCFCTLLLFSFLLFSPSPPFLLLTLAFIV
jgi:hypothetical protein